MSEAFVQESIAVLERTPATLATLLRGLPEPWVRATEGPGTWSPYDVIGHLIHGEKADWMVRVGQIRMGGQTFVPFDREAMFRDSAGKPMDALLEEFAFWRRKNLEQLRALDLDAAALAGTGTHPALGVVTLRQLLATWTAHDLSHLGQIARVMAKRYGAEVGPWAEYLGVLKGA